MDHNRSFNYHKSTRKIRQFFTKCFENVKYKVAWQKTKFCDIIFLRCTEHILSFPHEILSSLFELSSQKSIFNESIYCQNNRRQWNITLKYQRANFFLLLNLRMITRGTV